MPPRTDQPLHRRSIVFEAYEGTGSTLVVTGRLTDVRPWRELHSLVHDMELSVTLGVGDLVITSATATMHTFPHAECPAIAPAFAGLVGLSVGRGFTRAVQERFGGVSGCSHLEHLARGLGPAVMQAAGSRLTRLFDDGELAPAGAAATGEGGPGSHRPMAAHDWVLNTCHIWAEGGVGVQKMQLDRPVSYDEEYPVPSLVELRARGARGSDAAGAGSER